MIADLQLLEVYFERPECALFFEDLTRFYGLEPVQNLLSAGHLASRRLCAGPHRGRLLVWLADQARHSAPPS